MENPQDREPRTHGGRFIRLRGQPDVFVACWLDDVFLPHAGELRQFLAFAAPFATLECTIEESRDGVSWISTPVVSGQVG